MEEAAEASRKDLAYRNARSIMEIGMSADLKLALWLIANDASLSSSRDRDL